MHRRPCSLRSLLWLLRAMHPSTDMCSRGDSQALVDKAHGRLHGICPCPSHECIYWYVSKQGHLQTGGVPFGCPINQPETGSLKSTSSFLGEHTCLISTAYASRRKEPFGLPFCSSVLQASERVWCAIQNLWNQPETFGTRPETSLWVCFRLPPGPLSFAEHSFPCVTILYEQRIQRLLQCQHQGPCFNGRSKATVKEEADHLDT